MPRFSMICFAAVVFVAGAVKFSAQLEKDCGDQLLATLAKEENYEMKALMQKLIDNVQKGDVKVSQAIIKGLNDVQTQYAMDHYWIDACLPLKRCLECPVEL